MSNSIKDFSKDLVKKSLKSYEDNRVKPLETRVDNIINNPGDGTIPTEVIDARVDINGTIHPNLKNRLDSDSKGPMSVEDVVGNFITANDTVEAPIKDIQILGNTIQDPNNLADIKSAGIVQEDGQVKMSILSGNSNMITFTENGGVGVTGEDVSSLTDSRSGYMYCKGFKEVFFSNKIGNNSYHIALYDNNKEFITRYINISNISTLIPDNCHYVRVWGVTSNLVNAKLEVGNKATPYQKGESYKSEILMPCQLEGIGQYKDRLCYDEIENAWCIEKNIIEKNETWNLKRTGTNEFRYALSDLSLFYNTRIINCISSLYQSKTPQQVGINKEEGITIYTHSSNHGELIIIDKTTDDVNIVNKKFNESIFKFGTTTPQKIILPKSVQIQLNSFADKTHIFFADTEVDGTIKCKVSKSMGASLNSLQEKTDILRGQINDIATMQGSADYHYKTDKGYELCEETHSGVVKDFKMQGKTLINLAKSTARIGQSTQDFTREGIYYTNKIIGSDNTGLNFISSYGNFEVGNTITCIIENKSDVNCYVYRKNNYSIVKKLDKGLNIFKIKIDSNMTHGLSVGNVTDSITNYLLKFSVMFLEGDHTQNPPSYFEGLKSVGEDVQQIEVLSSNNNLFSYDKITAPKITTNNDELTIHNNYHTSLGYTLKDIGIPANTEVTLSREFKVIGSSPSNATGRVMVGSKTLLWEHEDLKTMVLTEEDINHNIALYGDSSHNVIYSNIMFNIGNKQSFISPKADKKTILYQNDLGEYVPVDALREWDYIEDGELIEGSGQVVFDGSDDEDWRMGSSVIYTSALNLFVNPQDLSKVYSISDIYESDCYYKGSVNKNIFYFHQNKNLEIRLDPMPTNLTEWKDSLKANPVTVVYQLAEPKRYKLAPLDLEAYANKTLVQCDSGVINSRMEFKIASYINNLVANNANRIDGLEDEVFKVRGVAINLSRVEVPAVQGELQTTQVAVDFLLMNSLGELKNTFNLGGRNMAAYFTMRIMAGMLSYKEVVAKYPQFQDEIDFLLKAEGREDLIDRGN